MQNILDRISRKLQSSFTGRDIASVDIQLHDLANEIEIPKILIYLLLTRLRFVENLSGKQTKQREYSGILERIIYYLNGFASGSWASVRASFGGIFAR